MQSAEFSSDGSYIIVTFSALTNRGGYSGSFSCAKLLSFSAATSGTCRFDADDWSKLNVYPSSTSSEKLDIGDIVTVSSGVIKSKCTTFKSVCNGWKKTMPSSSVSISKPSVMTYPVIVIGAPATVGVCTDVTIDLSASTYNGGRDWLSVDFTVISTTINASLVEDFLNQEYTISPPTPIPSSLLVRGGEYDIKITLCNFLTACSSSIYSLSIDNSVDLVPNAIITGSSKVTISHEDTYLELASMAYTTNCDGSKSYSNLKYEWSVIDHPELDSISKDDSKFKLMTSSLDVGSSYEIEVKVTNTITTKSSTASVAVYVTAASIVSAIDGGDYQTVRVGGTITIDGSNSYDYDQPDVLGTAAGLSYTWSCFQLLPRYSTSCPFAKRNGLTSSTLELAAVAESSVGAVAAIKLQVYDSTRISEKYIKLEMIESVAPVVTISTDASSLTNFDTRSSLVISGEVDLKASCTSVWSIDDDAIELRNVSLTAVSRDLSPGSVSTATLVLSPSALAEKSSYTFYLTCDNSYASIAVTTNSPPIPGLFSVAPSTGTELTTEFQFTASLWTDPDLPISYVFGFIPAAAASNDSSMLVVRSKSTVSYTTVTLPAGDVGNEKLLTCVVKVMDSYESSVYQNTLITVYTSGESSDDIEAGLLASVQSNAGVVESSKQVLAVASEVLNRGNCSSNCTAREALRHALVTSLSSIVESEDVSETTASLWIDNLGSIAQDPSDLNGDSVAGVQALVSSILAGSSELSYSVTSGLLGPLSSILTASKSTTNGLRRLTDGNATASNTVASTVLDSLDTYCDQVSSQIYGGQEDISTVTDSFSVASSAFTPTDDVVSLSSPIEDGSNSVSHTVSLTLLSTSTSPVKLSLITMSQDSVEGVSNMTSDVVRIRLSGVDATLSEDNVAGSYINVTLQNKNRFPFSSIPSNESFATQCTLGLRETKRFTCAVSNYVITHVCDGSNNNWHNSSCPETLVRTFCSSLDLSTSAVGQQCTLLSSTEWNTTCSCFIRSTSTSRKLGDEEVESFAVTIASTSGYIADQFAGTLSQAGAMDSPQDIYRVLTIIVMFGALWIVGIVLVLSSISSKEMKDRAMKEKRRETAGRLRRLPLSVSPIVSKDYIFDYIKSVIPTVFSRKSVLQRLWSEFVTNHKYFKLFYPDEKSKPEARIIGCLYLLSVQTMFMFLLAVFYDLQGPSDDGSCPANVTETTCLTRKSVLDQRQSYCAWDGYSCSYNQPRFTMEVMAAVLILTSLASTLLNKPIEYIFAVLNAPTMDSVKVADALIGLSTISSKVSGLNRSKKVSVEEAKLPVTITAASNSLYKARRAKLIGEVKEIPENIMIAHSLAKTSLTFLNSALTETLQVVNKARHSKKCSVKNETMDGYLSDTSDEEEEKQADGARSAGYTSIKVPEPVITRQVFIKNLRGKAAADQTLSSRRQANVAVGTSRPSFLQRIINRGNRVADVPMNVQQFNLLKDDINYQRKLLHQDERY